MKNVLSIITSVLLIQILVPACTSSSYDCHPEKTIYEITEEVENIDSERLSEQGGHLFCKSLLWKNRKHIASAFNSCPTLTEVRIVIDYLDTEDYYDRFGNKTKDAPKVIYKLSKSSVLILQKYQNLIAFVGDNSHFNFNQQYIKEGEYKGQKVTEFVIFP